MATKRIRMSKMDLNWVYVGRMKRAWSGKEIDDIARQRDIALYRPVRKPVVKRKEKRAV